MPDVKEVIKSLETAVKNFERYSGDEYGREYDYARVGVDVLENAIALLKAQEPIEPVFERQFMTSIEIYDCGKCGTSLGAKGIAKYCMKRGKAVKWDGCKARN